MEVFKSIKGITNIPLEESGLRKNYGINLVAIKRDEKIILDIDRTTEIYKKDILYCFGTHEKIVEFMNKLT